MGLKDDPKGWLDTHYPGLHVQLGKVPDRQLARTFGLSVTAIQKHRKALSIQPFVSRKREEAEALLREGVPWKEVMERVGASYDFIRRARKRLGLLTPNREAIEKAAHLLGTMSDYKLARDLGVPQALVVRVRNEKGIAPYGKRPRKIDRGEVRRLFYRGLSDAEIGMELECSGSSVGHIRRSLGLFRTRHDNKNVNRRVVLSLLEEGIDPTEIAVRQQCSMNLVLKLRRAYFGPADRLEYPWGEIYPFLGSLPSSEIFLRWGVPHPLTHYHRKKLGIRPPFSQEERS